MTKSNTPDSAATEAENGSTASKEREERHSAATVPPLDEAFTAWVEQHGYVWFAADLALAASIARHLGIDLEIDGVAVADKVPGVTQG